MLLWISKTIHKLSRMQRRLMVLLAVLGPGIITMVADNDAGGISTYAQTGAKTGFSLLWVFIILVPMAYYIQEMTVRLGAATKRGHAQAIFDGFGPFWGAFSIFDLAVVNCLTLVTEYIGMTQALSLFNIPQWITVLGVTALLLAIVITGKYWTFEKLTLVFCFFNLVYIPAAIWAMKTGNVSAGWSAVGEGFYSPHFHFGPTFTIGALITLLMANIGTTITPWQIFFQQSAVVDKGMDVKDVKFGKIDTFAGSVVTCLVAAFIIVVTASLFYHNPNNPDPKTVAADIEAHRDTPGPWTKVNPQAHSWQDIKSAAQTAAAIPAVMTQHGWGDWAKLLFAIGLFDAGFLGALCISLATSWALGEVFGWAHSLNRSVREAPWFYVAYTLMLLAAGAVCLFSGEETQNKITIFVQVVAVTLLPPALIFLVLLLNDKPLMGEHVNTRWQNVANWSIIIFVILMSGLYGVYSLFFET
jgi:NRAMP (natural resistance-associated macrophage protein)-like metal ion transporter